MSATTKTANRRRKTRGSAPLPTIPCLICGEQFRQITPTHLRKHGYSMVQYQRTFDALIHADSPRPAPPGGENTPTTASGLPVASVAGQVARAAAPSIAHHLIASPEFVAALADEVGELMFTTSMRDRLRLALASLLNTRLQLHGAAVANLQQVRAELAQPWRTSAGGKDGEPTPTPHLVMMAGEAHQEVVKAEEALLKTVKMAVDEANKARDTIHGLGTRPAFSGEAPAIPVPPELPPAERETIRTLLGLLEKEAHARLKKRAEPIDADAVPVELDGPLPPSLVDDIPLG